MVKVFNLLKRLVNKQDIKKYDIIYSIGRDCSCAMYLQKQGLRISSGPFDWLTNVNDIKDRLNFILNDFNDFLNLEDLKFLPKDPNVFNDEACDYYENLRNGFYYYHDFHKNLSLNDAFPQVKEKYNRRIERFIRNLKTKKKVLLVWFSHIPTADEAIIPLCEQICQKYGKQIDFLIIENDDSKADDDIEKKFLATNIVMYKLKTSSLDEKGNPTTMGREEVCSKLFKNYARIKTAKEYIKIILKKLFSIKNECTNEIKRKVITILGIKIKLRKSI